MAIMITRYERGDFQLVLETWEASVRATHTFLQEEDILFYKNILHEVDFASFPVYCLKNVPDAFMGFMGVKNNKLEMLFLHPEYTGKGYGRKMMEFSLKELQVSKVDVNEQNIAARAFYKRFGFEQMQRRAVDDYGKAYPILELMRRSNSNDPENL